jgi:hypothetical protein
MKKKPPKKVMHTRVDQLVWDCPPLPFNIQTLAIYLEFVPTLRNGLGRFIKCQAKNGGVRLFSKT